jgi:hypothetical protein
MERKMNCRICGTDVWLRSLCENTYCRVTAGEKALDMLELGSEYMDKPEGAVINDLLNIVLHLNDRIAALELKNETIS